MTTKIQIAKGTIVLVGYFEGTGIPFPVDKSEYEKLRSTIKTNGRNQIKEELKESKTEEKVADFFENQLKSLHKKITKISNYVDDEVLKRAWGENFETYRVIWLTNISSLLHLKRIKNDDMYGWQLMDYNSCHHMTEHGLCAMVFGQNMDKISNKFNKIISNH
jgi:hypothetical protein